MNTFGKIIDFLNNPISYRLIFATVFTSGILLSLSLLPLKYLERVNLVQFYSEYGYTVLIVFLFSIFILIIQLGSVIEEKRKDGKLKKQINKQQKDLINDPIAYSYLLELYRVHPEPALLPIYNQKVKLLEQYGLIIKATNQYPVYDPIELFNPEIPYILQPKTEKEIQKRLNDK
ncbi:hypothetical protein FPQ10_08295 [Allobacillus sp. SKP2-8]|uniref:super-infection exclusion protein B n=1 Tax=unclassified Allobacillus TaxID=2628859 RepID=UPI0011821F6B|nr:super-infection exclusion protein B [Allobacillus sp. SKP2-8]TSJ66130.1 hypothetical protein FPQ10_08295 [Allobacillus sp. SKP2-8]